MAKKQTPLQKIQKELDKLAALHAKEEAIVEKIEEIIEDGENEDEEQMAKNWIQDAIKKPGSLRASLGTKKGKNIPASKLASAAKKKGKLGQRARLAQTLKTFKKS